MIDEEVRGGVLDGDSWLFIFNVKLYACPMKFMVQIKDGIAATCDDMK